MNALPEDPVKAAEEAVKALRYARDCLRIAGASRALDRVRLALSSADGAVRAAGYRKQRAAEKDMAINSGD